MQLNNGHHPLLSLKQIRKSLGGRIVLDGVDGRVCAGEIVVLLGPNGAGKTTLLGAACGRVAPDSGSVFVCGGDPRSDPDTRRNLGFVPQGLALYPYLSVRENLQTFGRMMGVGRKELPRQIDKALTWGGLEEHGASHVETLSGGMKRRLNIVASLLHDPKLLLLDEPTVGVDVNARIRIHELLGSLRDEGVGILITTHDLDQAESLADRTVFLVDGKVRLEGAPQELVRSSYGSDREMIVTLEREALPEQSGMLAGRGLTSMRGGLTWVGAVGHDFSDAAGWTRDLDGAGLNVREIRIREPNLEGVFLRVTGEELRL
jgi:ABC-2 type transport system ATP-binding protein